MLSTACPPLPLPPSGRRGEEGGSVTVWCDRVLAEGLRDGQAPAAGAGAAAPWTGLPPPPPGCLHVPIFTRRGFLESGPGWPHLHWGRLLELILLMICSSQDQNCVQGRGGRQGQKGSPHHPIGTCHKPTRQKLACHKPTRWWQTMVPTIVCHCRLPRPPTIAAGWPTTLFCCSKLERWRVQP